jgi:tRNA G18 (ribose-2'-O)-methylase SpoU
MPIEIVSPDDPRIADYARVGEPRWIEERGLFVAEGRLVVSRLVADGQFALKSILVTPAALAALADLRERIDAPVYVCDQATLNGVTGFNFHRGCVALARRGEVRPIATLLGARTLVALERVGNPDNVGGIFRSALALGAGGVLLDPASGDPLYRKAIRTSMGAALRLPFARAGQWPDALAQVRDAGFTIVALTPGEGGRDIYDVARAIGTRRLALVAGHEGEGLSDAALAASDLRCRIPIDPASDSLNVSVAVGIALAILAPFSSRSSGAST